MAHTSPLPLHTDSAAGAGLATEVLRHAGPVPGGAFDELRESPDRLRERWQRFFQWAGSQGGAGLDQAAAGLTQQIRTDGITHNVYSEQGSAARPWSLELLPALIEPADWAVIEQGVVQRAELLNTMLADLYGPRRLLHDGLLPPALLFRHPGYLRPLHGVVPPGRLHLHIVAFDIARGPDGRWWTLAQRTQGPSGLGYVLHNRLLVSRAFPDAFREMRVQHIASSYRRLLDTVEALARQQAGVPPRIVLLTPGPHNETYFEHAYLARYLGLPLVEGGDLMVKGERLYLKTVEGLEPVHGVMRRLDDDYCDPLELRADSTLGVPGLLQAVRAGTVVMANALGSGFLESPAIQGFMPAVCERLLGQALAMPSLPSWWCGEPAAWEAVRGGLDDKLVRRSFPRRGDERLLPHAADSGSWAARIEADPQAWTVQARMPLSHTPLWQRGRVQPTPSLLRVYAVADGAGHWHVLPGGMTRVATGPAHSVSMQQGGSSLDTWVMTNGPVDTFSMLPQRLSVDDITARHRPVSSRTGENLFWLGRYTERTEQLVRLARATLNLVDADADAPPEVLAALSALAEHSGLAPAGTPSATRSPQVFERAVLAALGDAQGATSIGFNLQALAGAAGALRDRLSPEHWGLVRTMAESFRERLGGTLAAGGVPAVAQVLPALDALAVQLAAITGAQSDRMTRDHGWRLLTVGRFIERLIGVSNQLGTLLEGGALAHPAGIDLLLDLFDSTITFRARYQRHQDLIALTDLLVLDNSNPRAWACVLRRLRNECAKLPGAVASLDELLARLPRQGTGLTLDELRTLGDEPLAQRLAAMATQLAEAGAQLSDDIGHRYFAHADGGDQLQQI
ncbi:circularly permuted type 2 ATP-grasp protein [Ideonella sp. BN130291]|uniref:circularly permuted type 2 ATP-grasp protein n=1 Tax=Ideonella sp. BN130291 TaxID=3112940 RepID=UPI002E2763D4|nr:circularly permuted type 2 ATP-grasp protein [Ideonella sp. BN130291]